MPSDRTPGFEKKSRQEDNASELETVLRIGGSDGREDRQFQSDVAVEILGELYPLLLENCTDEDDEIDTQAVFEVLAGMMGLFLADYHEFYGHEKTMGAMQDLIDLSLNLYDERVSEGEDEE